MAKTSAKTKGFTLVEMMLYMALLGTILVAVTQFTWDVLYGGVNAYVNREVQQNARFVLEKMSYEIRKAEGIESISEKQLVLDNGASPTVTLRFDDVNSRITIQEDAGPEIPLTSEKVEILNGTFTDMSYSYPGASTPATQNVAIHMDVRFVNSEDLLEWAAEESYDTAVELRGQ